MSASMTLWSRRMRSWEAPPKADGTGGLRFMMIEEPEDPRGLDTGVLLFTLGGMAAVMLPVVYLLTSSAHGGRLLMVPVMAWLGFAGVVGLGAPLSILVWFVGSMLMLPLSEDTQNWLWERIRWIVLILGGAVIVLGGTTMAVDGWTNNRMQPADALYARCMTPQTQTYTESYRTCRDGWRSPSIGSRGACSHHGGVVTHHVQRQITEPPHSTEYCRADGANRSWID